jgi:hypothetical protein
MAEQIQAPMLHELLRWWPRPEPGPDPALFVLLELLKENPRALREIATVQLELSKEVHAAQIKAIDRAVAIVSRG